MAIAEPSCPKFREAAVPLYVVRVEHLLNYSSILRFSFARQFKIEIVNINHPLSNDQNSITEGPLLSLSFSFSLPYRTTIWVYPYIPVQLGRPLECFFAADRREASSARDGATVLSGAIGAANPGCATLSPYYVSEMLKDSLIYIVSSPFANSLPIVRGVS